ncbi:GDP-L-fucose synthase [Lachnospiraceae bacterium]|nr:GDP-L-fucose synthase [Lachnospiraceae bacterium]
MKKLIIGRNGFVGKNLGEFFNDAHIIGSSELNLLSETAVMDFFKNEYFDIVINTAVYNPRNEKNKEGSSTEIELENDLRMFHNIARCHDLYGKMIYFGSGAEYDKRYPICSVTEEDLIDSKSGSCSNLLPESQYGLAKYIIGREIESGIYGADNIYNLRIFGLFGKYENWKSTFISGACCKAMKGIPITIRQNVFFDYLYINDFCEMIHRFIQIEKPKYHTYNITSGRRVSLTELAEIVNRVSGKDVPVIICKDGLANEYTSSNQRLLSEIGDVDFTSFEDAIADLYGYYKSIEEDIDLYSLLYQA